LTSVERRIYRGEFPEENLEEIFPSGTDARIIWDRQAREEYEQFQEEQGEPAFHIGGIPYHSHAEYNAAVNRTTRG
jgi:hypothetical protein